MQRSGRLQSEHERNPIAVTSSSIFSISTRRHSRPIRCSTLSARSALLSNLTQSALTASHDGAKIRTNADCERPLDCKGNSRRPDTEDDSQNEEVSCSESRGHDQTNGNDPRSWSNMFPGIGATCRVIYGVDHERGPHSDEIIGPIVRDDIRMFPFHVSDLATSGGTFSMSGDRFSVSNLGRCGRSFPSGLIFPFEADRHSCKARESSHHAAPANFHWLANALTMHSSDGNTCVYGSRNSHTALCFSFLTSCRLTKMIKTIRPSFAERWHSDFGGMWMEGWCSVFAADFAKAELRAKGFILDRGFECVLSFDFGFLTSFL